MYRVSRNMLFSWYQDNRLQCAMFQVKAEHETDSNAVFNIMAALNQLSFSRIHISHDDKPINLPQEYESYLHRVHCIERPMLDSGQRPVEALSNIGQAHGVTVSLSRITYSSKQASLFVLSYANLMAYALDTDRDDLAGKTIFVHNGFPKEYRNAVNIVANGSGGFDDNDVCSDFYILRNSVQDITYTTKAHILRVMENIG